MIVKPLIGFTGGAPKVLTWATATTAYPLVVMDHSATILPDDRILVIGGSNGSSLYYADVYFGTVNAGKTDVTWAAGTALPAGLKLHNAVMLDSTHILVLGGIIAGGTWTNRSLIGTLTGGNNITWTTMTTSGTLPATGVVLMGLTTRSNGLVYVTCPVTNGFNNSSAAYIGTPNIGANTMSWVTATQSPSNLWRGNSKKSLLTLDSDDLVWCNGFNNSTFQSSTEILKGVVSGTTITWSVLTSATSGRHRHVGLKLPAGKLAVFGGQTELGYNITSAISTADGVTWTSLTSIPAFRYDQNGAALSNGVIVLIGGMSSGGAAQNVVWIGDGYQ